MSQTVRTELFKQLRALWADRRPYRKRLLYAAAASAAFCFTFLFFGPLELIAFSEASLSYSYKDVAGLLALASAGVFAVLALLLPLLRGKVFNYLVTLVFGITVAGYLQSAFFNGSLGALNGDAVDWPAMTGEMLGNLLIWLGVMVLAYLVMYLHRGLWKKAVTFLSLLLVVMQTVPAVAILMGSYQDPSTADVKSYALSEEGMYSFSEEENILVFVLDRMDYDYIDAVLQEDPTFFDRLDGFTSYTNAISTYARTQPALNHILTGASGLAYQVPELEYFNTSWENSALLPTLSECGYDMDFYTHLPYLFRDADYAEQYVSNLAHRGSAVKPLAMLKKLWNLSAYRYAPMMMKPFFWAGTNYYNNGVLSDEGSMYYFDDTGYASGYATSIADQANKNFKFYHWNGPHTPYTMNADGTESETATSVTEQMKGCFNILYSLFDRMKELGIYEDATIIITADHGDAVNDFEPLQKATRIGLFYKPSGSAGVPLQYSSAPVSNENIPATLVQAAGADPAAYGRPLDVVGEDETLTRTYYKVVADRESGKEAWLYEYAVTGDAADFSNWTQVSVTETNGSFY